jgi:hypothetical protein
MSNNITTVVNNRAVSILTGGPGLGMPTTISTANVPGQVFSVANGGTLNSGFSVTTAKSTGTLTLEGSEGNETAVLDAAFVNDLKLLLEVIKEAPDDHPLGDLKHDMRMRRAFKKLGG